MTAVLESTVSGNVAAAAAPPPIITQDIIVPIQNLFSSIASTVPVPETTTLPASNKNGMSVYATVLISLMLVALAVVCSITGAIICYSLRKRFLLRKLQLEFTNQQKKNNGGRVSVHQQQLQQRVIAPPTRTISYKKRHISRHFPQNKHSFRLLMRQKQQLAGSNNINTTQRLQIINNENASQCSSSTTALSSGAPIPLATAGSGTKTASNIPSPLLHSSTAIEHSPSLDKASSISIESSLNNENALVTTVKPLSIIRLPNSFQPTRTVSFRKSVSSDSNVDKNTPNLVSNPGWYERHLSRKKAMDKYTQLYCTSSNNTKATDDNPSPAADDNPASPAADPPATDPPAIDKQE